MKKRAVALIRFSHHPFTTTQHGIGSNAIELSTHHNRRIETTRFKNRCKKGCRGRLAVGSCHSDPVLHSHQLGEHLSARDYWNTKVPSGHDLDILCSHGRGPNDDMAALYLLSGMPHENGDTEIGESSGGWTFP
jgi:hypothetical protein